MGREKESVGQFSKSVKKGGKKVKGFNSAGFRTARAVVVLSAIFTVTNTH